MTDKQIIIHGVDIRLFRTPVEVMHYLQQGGLYVVTKELFEQLKAKEQECERLKENLPNAITRLMGELDQLKAENEAWQKDLATMDAVKETVIAQCKALKQTLTEIKEIGKKSMREGKMLSGGWLYQFIEQKISEVEDG